MNLKKLSLTLAMNAALIAAMTSAPPAARAQDEAQTSQPAVTDANVDRSDHQPPTPEKVVERLGTKLNLSEDQKQQLLPIITERQQKIQALRSDNSMRHRQKRHEMKSIFQDSEKKINGILNDQQKEQYAQLKQEMRQQMKEHRHNR